MGERSLREASDGQWEEHVVDGQIAEQEDVYSSASNNLEEKEALCQW